MKSENDNADYSIILSQLRIARLLGHNLLVLKDNSGKLISEIDGLATSKNGETKPVGYLPSDRLKAFEFKSAFLYESSQAQIALINANKEICLNKWNVALNAITLINTKNLPYPIFGLGKNSNSVTSTLIRCMDLHEPQIPSGGIAPFSGEILLSEAEIEKLQSALISR
ncbi:hypothetical protein XFHB_05505 [Xylella fastidiosa]|uniref:Phage-related protein n=1 Tax=Xylella fastidiosa TaxID=2371 RepID=A0ABC8AD24_XYLFS|nr:hypothetical protein [Xylella fastidiosa]ALR06385.1 hypothetical protein XFHB_05505 [Xylella fastidiosa]